MNFQKYFESGNRPASGRTAQLVQPAGSQARFHRVSWKEAIGKIASPAFRLHRYRSVHNKLLQTAWCKLDNSNARDCDQ